MKKNCLLTLLCLLLMTALLSACAQKAAANSTSPSEVPVTLPEALLTKIPESSSMTPTGYPSGEIQRPFLRYRDNLYWVDTRYESFTRQLPDDFAEIGAVTQEENKSYPAGDFCAARIQVGTRVYAREGENYLFIQSGNGYVKMVHVSGEEAGPWFP